MAVLRLIPAHAGNIPKPPYQSCQTSAHPHSHREHSFISFILSSHFGSSPLLRRTQHDTARTLRPSDSSPLARGASGSQGRRKPRRRLIPARAGTIRGLKSPGGRARAHPRSRGEQHQKADVLRVCLRLIPTRVGNMTRHIRIRHLHEVHPRSRGEHTVRACKSAPTKGSSPLAQGISRLLGIGLWVVRLTPARAGNMPAGVFLVLRPSAHPRSRGEHPNMWRGSHPQNGSSPLARGTFDTRHFAAGVTRLIPARAGNIGEEPCPACREAAHPRSRGEHSAAGASLLMRSGSSPLARGTFRIQRPRRLRHRLIPARAGNIALAPAAGSAGTAHPRSRGEHETGNYFPSSPLGSSPLARGTCASLVAFFAARRLIPARAGNMSKATPNFRVSEAHPRSRGEHN